MSSFFVWCIILEICGAVIGSLAGVVAVTFSVIREVSSCR